jgi:short-subunit dehydrogenase
MAAMRVLDLTGLTVIVTGASSGIGASTARLLHEAGAHPVLAARRADRLERLSDELGGALAVVTDVTDPVGIRRLISATIDRHGRIDGLVNNAGVSLHQPVDQLDLDELTRVLALNVVSVVAMTQAVLPTMRREGQGRIVNVSSGTTRSVLPGVGGYAATKAALNMLTAVTRKELEPDGIAVSLVVPSITATEFGGGRYQPGQQLRPGMVAHHPDYVGRVILRALRTGEERLDIPHGAEQREVAELPVS